MLMYFTLGTPHVRESCGRPGKMPQSRGDGLEAAGVTVAGGADLGGSGLSNVTVLGGSDSHP